MRRTSVLVVDDQPPILELDRDVLEAEGHRVTLALGGRHALELLDTGYRPDVIVCDLVMPGMDGLELVRRLKADERFADTPVLVCSGHPHLSRDALAAGAAEFFRKPFTARTLLELIDRYRPSDTTPEMAFPFP